MLHGFVEGGELIGESAAVEEALVGEDFRDGFELSVDMTRPVYPTRILERSMWGFFLFFSDNSPVCFHSSNNHLCRQPVIRTRPGSEDERDLEAHAEEVEEEKS